MQIQLADFLRDTPEGRQAQDILGKCVHCGFCTATCPTYQLVNDELDGPRGRIYLIKEVLEGRPAGAITQRHLDRCLSCRSCESTCPSGVQYGQLLEIGRNVVAAQVPRARGQRTVRWLARELLSRTAVFGVALRAARLLRPLLPGKLRQRVPPAQAAGDWPVARHPRRLLALGGCVQPSIDPGIDRAAARVLDALGISLLPPSRNGCCGAVRLHLDDPQGAQRQARANIDAWWPDIESGRVEGVVLTASACGLQVKEYGHLLQHDPQYAAKAQRISAQARDISEVLYAEAGALSALLQARPPAGQALAWHAPCTLQHGQGIRNTVEQLLQAAGYRLTPVAAGHLCCGSAGTYSIFQPQLSAALRADKLAALQADGPALIASGNLGCMLHLQAGTHLPVRHWITLIDARLAA
ncbi:glycolate oxidase subunit GlcF [Bordetella trematum]|uniref:glycolate oxidase subunit GlcF n=1 Tax=Bordetella trematum TaxID=123899 RepID=UPI003989FC12